LAFLRRTPTASRSICNDGAPPRFPSTTRYQVSPAQARRLFRVTTILITLLAAGLAFPAELTAAICKKKIMNFW
jgi:hypothetical protein